nr:unnamed protein product [Callosobruchus chinensis]
MKSKHEIPNKHDFMKAHSYNFILNERHGGVQQEHLGEELVNHRIDHRPRQNNESDESLVSHISLIMDENNRSHKDSITTGLSIISNSYTDVSGFAPKKYVTECYLKPKTGPYWFSESVTLQTHSTKRRYNEKIYFMNRLHPCKWSERMTTKTNSQPTNVVSECEIYVEGVEPKEHTIHIPLQPVNGI